MIGRHAQGYACEGFCSLAIQLVRGFKIAASLGTFGLEGAFLANFGALITEPLVHRG